MSNKVTAEQARTIAEFQRNIGQTAIRETNQADHSVMLTFDTFRVVVLPRGTVFRVGR